MDDQGKGEEEKLSEALDRESDEKSLHQVASELEFEDVDAKHNQIHRFIEHRYRLRILIEKAKIAKENKRNKKRPEKRKKTVFTLPMLGIHPEESRSGH